MKNERLSCYLESTTRNKLICFNGHLPDIEPINVGAKLAVKIKEMGLQRDKWLSLKVKEVMDEIFKSNVVIHPKYGKLLAISNLGILFEKDLQIDVFSIIEKYSSQNALFIKWDGILEEGNLYFLSKDQGKKINIKNLSHIAL